MRLFRSKGGRFRICCKRAAAVLSLSFALEILYLTYNWPFTRSAVTINLERFALSKVSIREHHMTFFPEPGYVAKDLVITRIANGKPVKMAAISSLTCRGSWLAMLSLTHLVKQVRADGMRISIPAAPVPVPMDLHPSLKMKIEVQEILADRTVLDIAPQKSEARPLRFGFSQLRVRDASEDRPVRYEAVLSNPEPPAELTVRGEFGPVGGKQLAKVSLSGTYALGHGELRHYPGLSGQMSARGSYSGKLDDLLVKGSAAIPDFAIGGSQHCVGISAEYEAAVNGLSGDLVLRGATAKFLSTHVNASGTIAEAERTTASKDKGKTTALDLRVTQGRIEDLLFLFGTSGRTPVGGPISLNAHVILPSGKVEFLRRVRLVGSFVIPEARFTEPETRGKVGTLSKRARGEKDELKPAEARRIQAFLGGKALVAGGVAHMTEVKFGVPGALAQGRGTFNLLNKAIDFKGTLTMRATLSEAMRGWKSLLIKPLNKLFEKGNAGAVLPVTMTGTYSHPSFKLSLRRKG